VKFKQYDYIKEEHLRKRIEWCQKNLEFGSSMADVLYIDEVGFNLSVVVAIGREGVIAHDVTLVCILGSKFLKFVQTKAIPSLDGQRFSIINVLIHKSCENTTSS